MRLFISPRMAKAGRGRKSARNSTHERLNSNCSCPKPPFRLRNQLNLVVSFPSHYLTESCWNFELTLLRTTLEQTERSGHLQAGQAPWGRPIPFQLQQILSMSVIHICHIRLRIQPFNGDIDAPTIVEARDPKENTIFHSHSNGLLSYEARSPSTAERNLAF